MPVQPKEKKQHRHNPTSSSASTAGPSRQGPKPLENRDNSGIPGISKLKSQIRQTKRFLAKDTLEPGLRISTQRRLTSLEADLAKAEQRDVAKKNGGKYHMIKFFERQKLNRIIKRCKKKITDETLKSSKRVSYKQDLLHARIMYNYILHYPNEQKYISLFPPDSSADPEKTKSPLPPHLSPSAAEPTEKSDQKRLEILKSVQGMMDRGEVSSTPEEEGRGNKVDVQVESATGAKKAKKVVEEKEEEDDFFETE